MKLSEEENTLLNSVGLIYFYIPHRIYHLGKVFNKESMAFDANFIDNIAYFVQGKLALLDNEGDGNYFGLSPIVGIVGPTYKNGLKLSNKLLLSPYSLLTNGKKPNYQNVPMEALDIVLNGFCDISGLDKTKVSHIIDNEIEKYINEDNATIAAYLLSLDGFTSLFKLHFDLGLITNADKLMDTAIEMENANIEIPIDLIIKDSVAERYFDYKDEILTNISNVLGEDLTFDKVKKIIDKTARKLSDLNIDGEIKREVPDIKERVNIFRRIFGEDNNTQKQIILNIVNNFENREDKSLIFFEYLMSEIEKLIKFKINDGDNLNA